MTFKEWIKEFEDRDHPFAEIAKAIYEDNDFPTDDDYEKIIDYINKRVDDNSKIQSFNDAIEEYNRTKK
ncbi:sterile alpha motif-like domain-containing protein [Erysipelotrichaceae bacterium OttesenSCG-928-M19]|nr:sterile alpha motif-like domain-containing protein [Erysipelotrichaceae bacterium OttesenSCG-928-M19]